MNSTILLGVAALVGAVGFLAAFKDVIELAEKLFGKRRSNITDQQPSELPDIVENTLKMIENERRETRHRQTMAQFERLSHGEKTETEPSISVSGNQNIINVKGIIGQLRYQTKNQVLSE